MRKSLLFVLATAATAAYSIDADKPIVARNPDVSADSIVFEFGTDIWMVPREGGQARRLTAGPGAETAPHFSPDGNWVAFTGAYDGNQDAFVVSARGGTPRRLTFHPGSDEVAGWTPDGNSVLFTSGMDHPNGQPRMYTVPKEGGWPSALPLPRGWSGSYSADASRIAYIPNDLWQPGWKRYKGGQTTPIWIARLTDSKVEKVPRQNSNDRHPMWVGDTIYFVSDRGGRSSLYSYNTGLKRVSNVIPADGFDIVSANEGPGAIVFEKIGSLHLYDLQSKSSKRVPIEISDDLLEVRPRLESVGSSVASAHLSPSGVRAVFEARGDIFTVPVAKGDARNITQTPGIAERTPTWSPDGKRIAYLSDASGNYELHVADQMGGGKPDVYKLTETPTWYNNLTWSPDSKKVLFTDQTLRLQYLDLATKKVTEVDREPYYLFGETMAPNWSPDNKWIVYTKRLKNKLQAVFLYNLESAKSTQLTDGLSDALTAVFDRGGKYIYFLASTDVAQAISLGGMSSMVSTPTRNAYVIVLSESDPSPLSPESDEEKIDTPPPVAPPGAGAGGPPSIPPGGAPSGPPPPPPSRDIKVDLENIGQRILSLPLPTASYQAIFPATPGSFLVLRSGPGTPPSLLKFSFATRSAMPFAQGVGGVAVTDKGDRALLMGGGGIQIVPTVAPPQPGQGAVNTSGMQMTVDPRAEWRQMFYESWRNMRDFLYDANTHGLDIDKAIKRYEPYVENLSSRLDFNYLLLDMMNEVSVGHTFAGGGDIPSGRFVPGGLLGADYSIENGRYRFAKIFNGENWNPGLRAPLTQPGAAVKAGEYLLAVNGKELTDKQNVYEAFEGTANKQVRIKVGPNPDGSGSREIVVQPVASEGNLRYQAWVEGNRRKVQEMSGGRISYVYMPDTSPPGYASFNRYFTAQLDKDAVLIDERYNGGGYLSDYVIQILSRKVLGMGHQRDHEDFPIPIYSNEGPKAMIINEMAGSGGDALPMFFRTAKIGKMIGKRTWGGLVAAGSGVPLMGGGGHTSPQVAIYGIFGRWDSENEGVAPDIEVEEDPALWRQGHDPQLERAVAHLMDELKRNPPPKYKRPPYPVMPKTDPLSKGGGS
jgi:tricorn protease